MVLESDFTETSCPFAEIKKRIYYFHVFNILCKNKESDFLSVAKDFDNCLTDWVLHFMEGSLGSGMVLSYFIFRF